MNQQSPAVEVSVGRQGRLVIPSVLRRCLGLGEGEAKNGAISNQLMMTEWRIRLHWLRRIDGSRSLWLTHAKQVTRLD